MNVDNEKIIRDDSLPKGVGYPQSVQLPDGSIFTVYYQKERPGAQCGLLWTQWVLPD